MCHRSAIDLFCHGSLGLGLLVVGCTGDGPMGVESAGIGASRSSIQFSFSFVSGFALAYLSTQSLLKVRFSGISMLAASVCFFFQSAWALPPPIFFPAFLRLSASPIGHHQLDSRGMSTFSLRFLVRHILSLLLYIYINRC